MKGYFENIWVSAAGIVKGLRVTLRYLFKPAITVQYPTDKLVPYDDFRGALLFNAERCIACNLCVKACPSNCIALENAATPEGKKIAKVQWYS
ncbi:MAG: 4Fe-4S binding protein, partial [Elusimicrobia bacterium]|nr:4Fe-4S binding protein [Elusimicrobiota bacterium]